MTDIVDELRARALQGRFNLEAADEIEQMRAALSELGVTPEEARAGVARSKAIREERDALRLRIKAAEKERDDLRDQVGAWIKANAPSGWIDTMRAELDAAKSQEPAAWFYVVNDTWDCYSNAMPPDDAYDKGTLIPLYAQSIPAIPEGWKPVPVEVVGLYEFMCSAFVPMTPQQEEIAKQLDLAKQAMKAAPKPEVK